MDIITDINENHTTGWIKIFRSIRKHWIWEDERKIKWWLDILLEVNHCDKKVSIGYKTFDCKKGESLMSLLNWGKRWDVSKTVVNNFFTQLEKDGMIKTVNETVTTRLIVCNYASYQEDQNASKTEIKQDSTATVHKQELKELKENKFNTFWESYHRISNRDKTDKSDTLKYWNKMSVKDMDLAIEMIQPYYDSLNDKKYCKKARTYLSDKNYNDEYKDYGRKIESLPNANRLVEKIGWVDERE